MRWKVGEITPGSARVPALPGIPPGDYTLEIRMYAPDKLDGLDILDAAGAPQGKTTRAGPFELAEAGRTRDGATLGLPIALDYQWDGRLALGSMSRLPASVAAGETFLVELGWRGLAPTDAAWSASLRLQPAGRDDLAIEQPLPLMQSYPTNEWLAGEWLRGRALLRAPASWPAGPAEASLRVQAGGAPTTPIRLGQVQVRAPAHDFTPPALATRLDARSGPLRLVGYRLEPQVPTAGAPVTVTLTWQTNEELSSAYTAFAQLLGADGKVVAQYDRQPAEGGRPTTGWVAGEFIADSYRFGAWPAGGSIVVGLYEAGPAGLRRLTWTGPAGAALGDALRLTP
jgi:hypothetical protein